MQHRVYSFVAVVLGRGGGGAQVAEVRVFLRFSLISLSGTAIDFLVLWGLVALGGFDVLPAKALASEGAIINTFFWNERWTFAGRTGGSGLLLRRFIAFNGASLGSLLVSLSMVALGVALWGPRSYLMVNVLVLPVSFGCTYVAANWVIWRRGKGQNDRSASLL